MEYLPKFHILIVIALCMGTFLYGRYVERQFHKEEEAAAARAEEYVRHKAEDEANLNSSAS